MSTSSGPSSRLLKAEAARQLGSRVAFNFEDLHHAAAQSTLAAREEAAEIVAEARREAEGIRTRAAAEGREDGRKEGAAVAAKELDQRVQAKSEQVVAERVRGSIPAIEQLAMLLAGERDRWIARWEDDAIRLSVAVAERILRREIAVQPGASTAMVRESLKLAAGSPELRVRMHPDDIADLGPQAETVVKAVSACGHVELTGDESILRGGCLMESRFGSIDARLETMLGRIVEELLGG